MGATGTCGATGVAKTGAAWLAAGVTGIGGAAGGTVCGAAPAAGSRQARPSNTVEQAPQRTRPLRTRSWSGTTLKVVPHCGQRVVRAMARSSGGSAQAFWPCKHTQPSRARQTDMAIQGA
jgi:hypothetical protein